jgi:ribosomal protein S3
MLTDNQLIVKYFALNNRNISAQFLVNYIIIRLGQYVPLNTILNPVIRQYKKLTLITGFKIVISGRLTRKERAAYIVKSGKSMPLATINSKIDYAYDFKIMRFGVVGVKVLLLSSDDTPYHYFFEFKNKLNSLDLRKIKIIPQIIYEKISK